MANLREIVEREEVRSLSEYATKSISSMGRKIPCQKCSIRTDFQRDRDRITHSKAFRRLMHKTQVFISPEGDHFRTRLTHTIEVAQIARTISRALKLNEDLTEAIALGHDLGHTPFGHTGEEALNSIIEGGFEHNLQSIRVVEQIENNGRGLNLTYEVLDGIVNHRGKCTPSTLEGKVVQISDKIAYINHDIDDAIRAGMLTLLDLPQECTRVLGQGTGKRIDTLVRSVIENSMGKNDIVMEAETLAAMRGLRQFMFDTVYLGQLQLKERKKIKHMLSQLYSYYIKEPGLMAKDFADLAENSDNKAQAVCDYIACMTDRFAIKAFNSVFVPSTFNL